MLEYVRPEERDAIPSIVANLERRLAAVPRGQSHGDFWAENFMVRDGRLDTVLDWEWAARGALPLLDLFDLIALSRRRVRDLTPGERFTEVLWPLVRAGGDESRGGRTAGHSTCPPTGRRSRALPWPTG